MTAEQLRAARASLDLTRSELAALLQVTERAVQAWELGTRSVPGPAAVALRLIAKYPVEIKRARRRR
jgi:DNA-binding transcriptional regulator YiaG